MAQVGAPRRISLGSVLREGLHAWRRDFLFITFLAALVEAPIVLAELAYAHVDGELPGTDEGFTVGFDTVPVAFSAMLAHYFLAAVIETVESAERDGHERPTVLGLVRSMPWVRLIVADVLLRILTTLGFALLVVPGVLIGTFTIVTLPLLNLERQPVIPTIRRSIDLVRGHVATALGVWFIVTVATVVAQELMGELIEWITDSQLGEYLAHLVTEVVLLPVAALPVVMLTFDLVASRVERANRSSH